MIPRPLLHLATGLLLTVANISAKDPEPEPSEATAAAAPTYDGPTLAAFQVLRYQTKTSLATLTTFLAKHHAELQNMSDRERDAFFDKHIQLAKDNTTSPGQPSAFTTVAQQQQQQTQGKGQNEKDRKRSGDRGPPPEVRAKYEALSAAAKEKVHTLFRDNREKLNKLSEEERRKFMESAFNKIAEEDQRIKDPKPAKPNK